AAAARAEAERLEAEAGDRRSTAETYREQHQETVRQADELDPDVDAAPTDEPTEERGTHRG
ncbi:MAG: hypothetical protein HOQ22_08890, partial [Nocardioidaceae bacterium]|nr:hypothetical protein [Nocardioidaceae bacterium]